MLDTEISPEDLRITTKLIYHELRSRGIEIEIVNARSSLLRYKDNRGWHNLRSTLSDRENAIAYIVAKDKLLTAGICDRLAIRHPRLFRLYDGYNPKAIINEAGRVVVKPANGAHGANVTLDVTNEEALVKAVEVIRASGDSVIVQEMVDGDDYRVLMIDGTFVAAIKRIPAGVVGDGQRTIRELIVQENQNPERGENYSTGKEIISMEAAERYMNDKLDLVVPLAGELVRVVGVPNLSMGGSAIDVTDSIPNSMLESSHKIIDELHMGICGVDFLWDGKNEPCLIEINATPGIDMHDDPQYGTPRGAIRAFVDYILG